MTNRRVGVALGVGAMLAAAVLVLGGGAASAGSMPCNDTPAYDTTVANQGTYAGYEVNANRGADGNYIVWACFTPTGGESAQKFYGVAVDTTPSSAGSGATANVTTCGAPVGAGGTTSQPWCPSHTTQLGATGATADPTTTTNGAFNATQPGAGAAVGTRGGTCYYVNGVPNCPGGVTLGSVTVAEGDLTSVGVHQNAGSCVTVNGGCPATAPSGVGVSAFKGDPTMPTVEATIAGRRVSQDLGGCYVGVNAPSSC